MNDLGTDSSLPSNLYLDQEHLMQRPSQAAPLPLRILAIISHVTFMTSAHVTYCLVCVYVCESYRTTSIVAPWEPSTLSFETASVTETHGLLTKLGCLAGPLGYT